MPVPDFALFPLSLLKKVSSSNLVAQKNSYAPKYYRLFKMLVHKYTSPAAVVNLQQESIFGYRSY